MQSLKTQPLIYIIIINWNNYQDTIQSLQSVFESFYSNYKTVIVDNGSTNDSLVKMRDWAKFKDSFLQLELSLSLPRAPYFLFKPSSPPARCNTKASNESNLEFTKLILIQAGQNLGFAAGCNAGICYALENGADYVLLLNNDVKINPSLPI